MKLAVLGAGAWGTALAISLSQKHDVTLWARDPAHLARLAAARTNLRYLPGIVLPDAINLIPDLAGTLDKADLSLIATSTAGLAAATTLIHEHAPDMPIIWVCKGFDQDTGKLPHETVGLLMGTRPGVRYGALSGPSFAFEVAKGLPCALTLAANDLNFARDMTAQLSGPTLRIYSSDDLVGVELGGALKNVMAIAAGICDGMQLGMNARAALITRGLAEIVRLGVSMGGKPETFMGLAGLGDLVLTATGDLSRNRAVGVQLAQGKTLDAVLASLGHVAEGVNSAQTALALARRHNVDMPITEAVNAVLFSQADPRATVSRLLSRDSKAESA
ncbi:MAG: NAD(P)-dependent glycerol-3-phosphate dehydrogenase [Burkholderiales bacterium]|nr:NAD(P)-dependent glycerol-3-phosphate dehydrogenase [Burkholderiales bacterium]